MPIRFAKKSWLWSIEVDGQIRGEVYRSQAKANKGKFVAYTTHAARAAGEPKYNTDGYPTRVEAAQAYLSWRRETGLSI